jgi:hypothetical protein
VSPPRRPAADPTFPDVDPATLALRPRSAPPADVVAVITAAAELVWSRPALPEESLPPHDAWRFSGRWWAQPATIRRARPWARL